MKINDAKIETLALSELLRSYADVRSDLSCRQHEGKPLSPEEKNLLGRLNRRLAHFAGEPSTFVLRAEDATERAGDIIQRTLAARRNGKTIENLVSKPPRKKTTPGLPASRQKRT